MNLEMEFAEAQRRTQAVIDRGVAAALRRIGPTAAERRERIARFREQMARIGEQISLFTAALAAVGDAACAAARTTEGKTNA